MLLTRLYRLLLGALSMLPLPVLQVAGSLLGSVLWISNTRMAQVSRENIRLCYSDLSEQQQNNLTRLSLQETGKTIVETAFAWAASDTTCLRSIVSIEGKTALDQRLRQNVDDGNSPGVIFIIPHLGNWEIINHYLGRHYALTHMYLPNKSLPIDGLIQAYRSRTGTKFVAAGIKGIRRQLQILKTGGAIGAMPDQEPDVHTGSFARFFGQHALTSQLIPGLAGRTGAVCVLAYCKRLQHGTGFKVFLQQIDAVTGEETLSAQTLNDAVEQAVRRVPEQYLWSYKRFRTRQDGEKELYQLQQHPLAIAVETAIISGFLRMTAALNLVSLHVLSLALVAYFSSVGRKYLKVTRRNISLCYPLHTEAEKERLTKTSLGEFSKNIMETGKIWHSSDEEFGSLLLSIEGLENIINGATIVMTPPLGNREVVMRYLGRRFFTTEYYHPNSSNSLDGLIRRQRYSMGIGLLDHTRQCRRQLLSKLHKGEVITLCPDQQPRLRSGVFVPFFNVDALTTLAIPYLLRESHAALLFAIALRTDTGFRLYLHACDYNIEADDRSMLSAIHRQFEEVISANQNQYRWSDKRFNIRPPGVEKLYRS